MERNDTPLRPKRAEAQQPPDFLLTEDSPFFVREAYKDLRTNLMFALPDEGCRKILVTSSLSGEGKSTLVLNLGLVLAESQARVLILDCDLRKPMLAHRIGIEASPGLSDLLAGLCGQKEVLHSLPGGLYAVPAGNVPPNPSELLGSERMRRVITEFAEQFSYILFDSPPVTVVSDAALLAPLTSGALLVARREVATLDSIQAACRRLEHARARILGFVYTGAPWEKKDSYYQYGYGAEKARHGRRDADGGH